MKQNKYYCSEREITNNNNKNVRIHRKAGPEYEMNWQKIHISV